jgi:hypothetical protein
MENCFGQQGWKEFNRNRKDILSELDKILEQTENRPVQVAHGQGVEAYLRKWLAEFLPKKYGVTSGYIIPNLYDDSLPLYHFDIIIYNQFEAPILWTEGNLDQSEQGKYRAIPAKHVVAVYEVKSRLKKSNVTDALEKLNQTKAFTNQLNPLYSCGIIFIDLKETENNTDTIIKELIKGKDVFGFVGGIILRYEGDISAIGRIRFYNIKSEEQSKSSHLKPIAKPIDSLNIYLTEDGNLEISEQGCGAKLVATSSSEWSVSKSYGTSYDEYLISVHVNWSRSNFSNFCIDLISTLEGFVIDDKNRPSFGQIFDNIEIKKAQLQGKYCEKGKPFLSLRLYEGSDRDKLIIKTDSITFIVSIENNGDKLAILSDDAFKTKCLLESRKTAIKEVTYQIQANKTGKTLIEMLEIESIEIPFRVVYYSNEKNKDFTSIETKIRIFKNQITMIN